MIKLKAVLPILALSLGSLSSVSCLNKQNAQQQQKTEIVSTPSQQQDTFEKSETNNKDKEKTGFWFYALCAGGLATYVTTFILDRKERHKNSEYAKICEELERDYYYTGDN